MRLPSYSPLLTDFYQLTMAYGYWAKKMHEQEACFHLLFRRNPFKNNYAVHCGLGSVIDFLQNWRFKEDDLHYLAGLKNVANKKLFPKKFLDYLRKLRFSCSIDAIPEGTVVFAHEPLLRIQGPLLQCQLLESPLLNLINFQSLIATKASRVCLAAQEDPVIEFGLRRAQGPDGALSASRAAYIGGCIATSNTLAGKLYDIPVKGTHAHSWVSAFPNEKAAFAAYADVMAQNCVLLVDTYNTLNGVKNAIEIGKRLKKEGAALLGIRLDSGNLAELSKQARVMLDQAGFKNTAIIASNSLDEYVITKLKQEGAAISDWGAGTNLATAYDQPALDGVYKLAALRDENGKWQYKLKLSEDEIKVSNPGRHQVRRFFFNEQYIMDVIYDLDLGISDTPSAMTLDPPLTHKHLSDVDAFVDLLEPIYKKGKLVAKKTNIHELRSNTQSGLKEFLAWQQNKVYPVGIESRLYDKKIELMKNIKEML